jgi:hypothetical protein
MKSYFLAFVSILLLQTVSYAGDPYDGYAKFVGQWKIIGCVPKNGSAPTDLSISLTEVRDNAVNVYFLNFNGKKSKLHFSTAGILRAKGHVARDNINYAHFINDRSDETGIRVTLRDSNDEFRIEITLATPNDLLYERRDSIGMMSCHFRHS